MSNSKKITATNNVKANEINYLEQSVDDFVIERERTAEIFKHYDDHKMPVTVRLDKLKVALLDHLVERWRENRSNMAAELLEEMIWIVFHRVYKEKTIDELSQLQTKLFKEFEVKQNKKKLGKMKKGDK